MKLLLLLAGVVCSYGLKPARLQPMAFQGSIDRDIVSKLKKAEDVLENVEKAEEAQKIMDNVKQEKDILEKFFFNINPSNILNAILSLITTLPAPAPTSPPQTACDCGLKATASERIVGGQEADMKEHPWQVGIVYDNGDTPWCGGTLVSDRHVITAAHCTAAVGSKPDQIQVLLGAHKTNDDNAIRTDVISINDDPNYNFPDSDFSILTLATPVIFSDSVRPACLPSDLSKNYAGELATVTGWGTLASQGGQPDVLMEVNVTVTSETDCRKVYGSEINGIHICAAGNGKDSCQGDSGGPLVVKENGRWTLIGVVSFGEGCAKKGVPGVYARITNRMNWIGQNTAGTATSGTPGVCK